MVSVTCYGGVNEIGGNKLLVETTDTSVFLDFGHAFGAESEYYEEFLQPRSNAKLQDLLTLNLTPHLDGIYRRDALRPDRLTSPDDHPSHPLWNHDLQSYETAKEQDEWTPDAIVLSHAHLDHAGYIPYLGDIPLYCSPATKTVLDTLVDLGNLTGYDGDLLEIHRRQIDTYSGGFFPGEPTLRKSDPHPRSINTVTPDAPTQIGDMVFDFFDVGHSIPGTLACLIDTPDAQVVYTGDVRFHGRSGIDLGQELAGLRPDVLLCEGTRINQAEPDDEQRVEDDMTTAIEQTDGLAMVGFAWKDLERYDTVRNAAHRADRIPVFDPRLAYLKARFGESVYDENATVFVERSDSMLYSPGDYSRSKHKAGELRYDHWDNSAGVTDTVHLENGVTAIDLRDHPEQYVLQLDYFRFKNLVDIDPPPGSTFIRAQTEPFNDEMKISEDRLTNWLNYFNINTQTDHDPLQIHASGHASGPELQAMINAIQPETLIPIHTEHPDLFDNPAGDVVIPEPGIETVM